MSRFFPAAMRTLIFLACFMASLLATFIFVLVGPLSEAGATGLAAIVLLLSLPLVDSALFGKSVKPELAGVIFGLPMGFFLRQSMISPELASGASRVVATAIFISIVLAVVRLMRSRRQSV